MKIIENNWGKGEDNWQFPNIEHKILGMGSGLEIIFLVMYSLNIHFAKWRCTMKATVVDLRYKMNDVLKALDRNEKVTVLYRGKVKGFIIPPKNEKHLKITEHSFFGMSAQDTDKSVLDKLNDLRKPRYNDI